MTDEDVPITAMIAVYDEHVLVTFDGGLSRPSTPATHGTWIACVWTVTRPLTLRRTTGALRGSASSPTIGWRPSMGRRVTMTTTTPVDLTRERCMAIPRTASLVFVSVGGSR
jgi:hypothetical protein